MTIQDDIDSTACTLREQSGHAPNKVLLGEKAYDVYMNGIPGYWEVQARKWRWRFFILLAIVIWLVAVIVMFVREGVL